MHLQVTPLQLLHHDRLNLAGDFRAHFRNRDHRIVRYDAAHRGQQLRSDDPRIKVRSDFLREKIHFFGNRAHDDGRLQLDQQIVGAQRIDHFRITLQPHVIDIDVVPGGSPIEPRLQGLCRQSLRERIPAETSLPRTDRVSAPCQTP